MTAPTEHIAITQGVLTPYKIYCMHDMNDQRPKIPGEMKIHTKNSKLSQNKMANELVSHTYNLHCFLGRDDKCFAFLIHLIKFLVCINKKSKTLS